MSRKELLGTLGGTGRGHILGADPPKISSTPVSWRALHEKLEKYRSLAFPFPQDFHRVIGHNTCLMGLCTPTGLKARPRQVECNHKYTLLPRWEVTPGMATLSLHRTLPAAWSWMPHSRPEWRVWNTQKNEKKKIRKKNQTGAEELALKRTVLVCLCWGKH